MASDEVISGNFKDLGEGWIAILDDIPFVNHAEAFLDGVHELPVALLRFVQCFFIAMALGDIACDQKGADNLPVIIAERGLRDIPGLLEPSDLDDFMLDAALFSCAGFGYIVRSALAPDDFGSEAPLYIFKGMAESLTGCGVHPTDSLPVIEQEDHVRIGLESGLPSNSGIHFLPPITAMTK